MLWDFVELPSQVQENWLYEAETLNSFAQHVETGEKLVVIFRCDGYRKNAGKLAERIFGSLGSAGGHKGAARAEVPLKNLQLGEKEFTSDILKRFIMQHI